MVYLMWQDDAPRERGGRRRQLAERLAPALARFREKFGRPATVALVPADGEEVAGLTLPVRVRPAIGTGQLWVGAPATPASRRAVSDAPEKTRSSPPGRPDRTSDGVGGADRERPAPPPAKPRQLTLDWDT
jgi:hypothetical protein